MRVYLPHEMPKTPVRGYRKKSRFPKFTFLLFIFSLCIIAGAVAILMAVPWKVAIGGALAASGFSVLKASI